MGKLAGKVAIVTGAGSGMGKAIAILFASEGANVVVSDMNFESTQEVVSEIKNKWRRGNCDQGQCSSGS